MLGDRPQQVAHFPIFAEIRVADVRIGIFNRLHIDMRFEICPQLSPERMFFGAELLSVEHTVEAESAVAVVYTEDRSFQVRTTTKNVVFSVLCKEGVNPF